MAADTQPVVALLAGASGFVGARVLDVLLDAPEVARVIAVTRRPLGREHPRLAKRIVQFDHLERQLAGSKCQVAFCCLGSRLGEREGGEAEALRRVDLGYNQNRDAQGNYNPGYAAGKAASTEYQSGYNDYLHDADAISQGTAAGYADGQVKGKSEGYNAGYQAAVHSH